MSLRLGLSALVLALFVGIPIGMIAALKQNSRLDHAVMAVAMTGIVVPNFVVAPFLVLVLGVYLKWLPVGEWNDGAPANMVMPVIALGLPYVAYVARMTRGSMVEVLRSNFVRTARAKGLPLRLVLTRHALKPAMLPVVSFFGPALAGIVTGSVIIEQIFGLPGIGPPAVPFVTAAPTPPSAARPRCRCWRMRTILMRLAAIIGGRESRNESEGFFENQRSRSLLGAVLDRRRDWLQQASGATT